MPTRLLMLCLLAATTVACDKEAHRFYLPTYSEPRLLACNVSGFCHQCSVDFDGEFTCGYRFSMSCDGKRPAMVLVKPYEVTYESGAVRQFETTITQSFEGECRQRVARS